MRASRARSRVARSRAGRRRALAATAAMALVAALTTAMPAAAAGLTRWVDSSSASCTNTGTGTSAKPYCTIQAAASAAQPGDVVQVRSGSYTENVQITHSGLAGAPITFQPAPGASVTVTGQIHGFTVAGTSTSNLTSWIVISGFNVTGTTGYGVYLKYSSHVTLTGNHVTLSGKPVSGSVQQGIYLIYTSDSLVANNITDHNSDTGIYLTTATTRVEVAGNISFANARVYTRAATGIDVRSAGNTVHNNKVYGNEDSGIQLYNGADGTVVYDNVSYGNGDHGIDVLNSVNTVVVANTVYNNVTSGINFEGKSGTSASSGATVRNNISVDNGLTSTTTKGNLRVDASSIPGTSLDYDMVFLHSAGTMMTWGTKTYTTLSSFTTASGQERNAFGSYDPAWVAPSSGDFHLRSGSKAIDSADSGAPDQPATDFDGSPRIDDPATTNIGSGPRGYDDRGAFEYQPDLAPAAALSVSPASGAAPLAVTADASASTDTDATPIASYTFDFGDGTAAVGPQSSPTALHTYSSAGGFTVTVTVTDTGGRSSTAQASVSASSADSPPAAALSVSPADGQAPLAVTADASASTDTDVTPVATYAFDFGDGTPAVGPQAAPTATHTYASAGTFTSTVTVRDTGGLSASATAQVVVGGATVDEVHYSWLGPTSVAFDWRGGPSTIQYGTSRQYGQSATGSAPSPMPYSSPGPFWEAQLTGLSPGTTYHYSIGGSNDETFSTAPTGPFRFDVEADIGDSITYPAMGTTQGQIAADAPDMVLVPGDLSYGEAHGQQAVDQHFNDVMSWSQNAAYMVVWGNHEWDSVGDDLRNYKGRFAIPNAHTSPGAPSLGCCGEDWGWFDAGGVRFISYPEPYAGSTWSDWQSQVDPIMAAAQADPSIRFIVTFGHRPAYSTGSHPGSTTLASILSTLGDRYSKFVLNLNGHSHDYERFTPIHGVVNVTAGGGGAALEPPWTGTDPRSLFRAMHLAHLRVDVTSTALTIQSICGPATSADDTTCVLGSVLDSTTIAAPADSDSPPSAALALTPTSGTAPLQVTADASGSTDTDSTPIASYAFDFGDGTQVTGQSASIASHVYTSAGTYVVTTTVTDTVGRPATATATVTVTSPADTPPLANLSVSPSSGAAPLAVTADASASTDTDATPIATYTFDFGDGTVVGPQAAATATHTYTFGGSYAATVTVTDTGGHPSTATASVSVQSTDAPPVAAVAVNPSSGTAPLLVTADASASTDTDSTPIATYTFDFGDGTVVGPQGGATATHTYTTAGQRAVKVTVQDTAGQSATATASVSVASADLPPAVAFVVTPTSGNAPLLVSADASGSTDTDATPITSYRFDFGDGTLVGPQAGATASHQYGAAGNYTVTVTVTDSAAQSSTSSVQVTVAPSVGTNLVGNPGFETNTTGWNNNGRTGIVLARVAGGHSGGFSAQLSNTTTSTSPDCTLNDSPNWVKTTLARTYLTGSWVRADTAGAKLNIKVREYNNSVFVAQQVASVTLSTSWQQVQVSYVPQYPGSSTLDVTVYTSNAPPGTCFYADDVSITVS